MTSLVTLVQAKAHLRMDHDEDDEQIEAMIEAASGAVLNYLDDAQYNYVDTGGEILEDSSGPITIPPVIQQATLLMLGDLYRNREPTASDVIDPQFGYGYLPRAVVALLFTYRAPTIG